MVLLTSMVVNNTVRHEKIRAMPVFENIQVLTLLTLR